MRRSLHFGTMLPAAPDGSLCSSGRRAHRLGSLAVVIGLALLVGCSGSTGSSAPTTTIPRSTTTAPPSLPVAPARWTDCRNGMQCARVVVPIDYARPGRGTMLIGLTRLPAGEPTAVDGTLFFDTGGPGLSGDEALRALAGFMPLPLREHLDIVAMSRRGTGTSSKLACGPTPAQVTAVPLADPAALTSLYARTLAGCRRAQTAVGDLSTVTAARDLDRARQALGLARIDYLGLSYGTLLGDAYVHLFPQRVRAMVLDGAVDPKLSLLADADAMAPVDQRDLATAMAGCATPTTPCPLGADPTATYERVRAALAAKPEPGTPPVSDGDLAAATLMYLTVPSFTAGFFPGVADAAAGDGSKLRGVAVGNYQDIDGSSTIGPYWATTCDDNPDPVSTAQVAAASARLGHEDPDTGREAVAYAAAGCVGWPPSTDPIPTGRPNHAPPVVVIGGTDDPQTPLAWARNVVTELGPAVGRLVIRHSAGHTAFLNDPGPCVVDIEVRDLLDGVAPPAVTTCAH